ncbi:MAG: type II toxin-antitoxin system RelE/ParE family toxin [Stellaceae bacterium]
MSGRTYRLTELADADIDEILTYTHREFGPRQFEAYWAFIDKAGQLVGENPLRPSSRRRDELGQGVRSFHIEIAAGRRGAASHVLYYISGALEDGTPGAVILRVLGEGMEPGPLAARGLDEIG